MEVLVILAIIAYLVIGLFALLGSNDTNYPILTVLFWPAVVVYKLVMEIIGLIEDIKDGTFI